MVQELLATGGILKIYKPDTDIAKEEKAHKNVWIGATPPNSQTSWAVKIAFGLIVGGGSPKLKMQQCLYCCWTSCWELVAQCSEWSVTFSGRSVIRPAISGPHGLAPMTPNLAPVLLLLLLLPWPQPAGAVSPRLLQECPGPPLNGSQLGNPPVRVTLGYLTAVTGTMNNRQVSVNTFMITARYLTSTSYHQ